MIKSTNAEAMLIAHRGASTKAPENTLVAFRLAWQEGADGIEADFRLTLDGRIVCLHDATTGRTSQVDLAVAQTPFDELRRLDAGLWKGDAWQGERIPLLEEILDELPPGKRFFIELKGGEEMIAPLKRVLSGYWASAGQLRLLAFDSKLVSRLKEHLPDIRVCLNVARRRRPLFSSRQAAREELIATLEKCRADGLSSQASPLLDAPFVDELHRAGREAHVWTVDSVRVAGHYRAMGVDSIMTNRPGWLRSRLP